MYGAESHVVAYLAQLLTVQDPSVTHASVWPATRGLALVRRKTVSCQSLDQGLVEPSH